jgi:hypothetical protein
MTAVLKNKQVSWFYPIDPINPGILSTVDMGA